MNANAEFDLIVYGASGYTGRLVAEHLAQRYGVGGEVKWAMAGRSAEKLAQVRDEIGAPKDTPLVVADAADPASVREMVRRAKAVVTTVGPYQLYGSDLVAACAEAGTDYLDLCGEPNWMRKMIDAHDATAKQTGARILFSCGFDSIPFELGVYFVQEAAKKTLGAPARHVKGRVRKIQGGLSGGTAASGKATMEALQKDPSQMAVMMSPFGLTPGFEGPAQPPGMSPEEDPDVGPVAPFMMAVINTKNVHRSNLLMGHAYGKDFVYDEMAMGGPGGPATFTDLGSIPGGGPKPGEGPTKAERESGFYDLLFIARADDGRQVRAAVKGDKDPGYGSTSKMLAETAIALVNAPDVPGGVWTPGAALQGRLVDRLSQNAGLTFEVEAA
ncbi:saccharopine dehydrogenase NADP-binding domain-containing protein [Phenylobacterium sp. J426]|uniref:saccharopine dehydrogenase family protein n=1 Tax=Phenylobacterium sp. J426 TaxID=2898439 RepID=UPI002151A199|nr:saccharopine dehydrogenase NADP-binding domain-containing protein [Phenylobacterium sp. J426]MCR5875108.1 saccharopine dehydrogenase NADP-binding domain-containing protein [Phenylobacterium sp. J426]